MKTVIYIDVLLAVNLLMTYILLLSTCFLLHLYVRPFRMFLGATVGSIYSLVVLLPDLGWCLSFILRIVVCIIIVAITFHLTSLRQFLRCNLYYIFTNAAFAGFIILLQNLLQQPILMYHNASVYCNIDLPLLIILTAVSYVSLKILFSLFKRDDLQQSCLVRIYLHDKYVEVNAIADTGNSLIDPISGALVSIVSFSVIEPLLPYNLHEFYRGNFSDIPAGIAESGSFLSLIKADFVAGEKILPLFKADKMVIKKGKKLIHCDSCMLAVTLNQFENFDYKMLLHPDLLNEFIIDTEERIENVAIVGNRNP